MNKADSTPPAKASRSLWPRRLLRVCLLLLLLLIAAVLALPHALPWLLQKQGIDFHWQNPQWQLDGFTATQVQLTLPSDNAEPQQIGRAHV